MKRIAKTMMPALLIAMMIVLTAEAQPGPGYGRPRGPRVGQNQRGPQMRPMDDQGPGPRQEMRGPGRGPGLRLMQILRGLDLTPEQHEQIRTIMDEHKEAAQAAQDAVQKVRASLHDAVTEGADEVAIRAIANNLAQAIGDQAVAQVTVTGKIKAVLTEEQQSTFDELIKKAPEGPPMGNRPQQRLRGRGPGRGMQAEEDGWGRAPRQQRRQRQRPRE